MLRKIFMRNDLSKERFRNEWKYLISTSEKELLELRMKHLLKKDPNAKGNGYMIRSLYFEDYFNNAYAEKESGVLMRKKYRIRIYEFYVECVSNLMRPRTIVDYDRVPWIMDEGTVRITFDSDVRAAVGSYDIFDPSLPTLPVLEAGKLVMEVKFTEMLPQIVRDLLPPNAQEFTAVSKYVLCYEKSQYLHGFEYWNETQERKLL